MANCKISVIVPVYNVEKYLKKCLDSIIDTSFKDYEIIVVNDGSTDRSLDILKEYEQKYNFIKVINQKNHGLGNARNKGIKESCGNYLFFVDSDDFLEKDSLKKMYDKTNNGNLDLVICDYYRYYNENKIIYSNIIEYDGINNLIISMPTATCKLIKKSLFNTMFLENYYYEDNAVMPYIVSKVNNYFYLKEALYNYTVREGSILKKKNYDPRWKEILISLEYMEKLFKDNNTYNKYHDEIEYLFIDNLLHGTNIKMYMYKESRDFSYEIIKKMKQKFPKWNKNIYYKQHNWKYKVIVNLFYYRLSFVVKILLGGNK